MLSEMLASTVIAQQCLNEAFKILTNLRDKLLLQE